VKILHTADWHLRGKDLDEASKCLAYLIGKASEIEPDFIVIAGDETDSNEVRLDSQVTELLLSTIAKLAEIAPLIICGGTPYHEGSIADRLRLVNQKFPIHTFTRPGQTEIPGGWNRSAFFTVIPQPTKKFIEMSGTLAETDGTIENGMGVILASMGGKSAISALPHILVGHWTVGGAYISENQQMIGRDIEISKDQITLARADLVCLGHIHKAQQIEPNIFYSGSLYSLNAGELDAKGFWLHTMAEDGTWDHKFYRTPAIKRLVVDYDFTDGDGFSEQALLDAICKYSPQDIEGAKLHIRLRLYQDEADKINQERVEELLAHKDRFPQQVIFERIRVPRQNIRAKNILKLSRLRDKLQELARVRGEELSLAILEKADTLESTLPDKLIEAIENEATGLRN